MTQPTEYTLCDVEINVSLLTFIAYFWEVTSFFRPFLNNIQRVKEDPTITPWELVNEAMGEENSGHYSRTIVAQHKIPGFSWLPWLPMFINSVKREVISYSTESRELTISEFRYISNTSPPHFPYPDNLFSPILSLTLMITPHTFALLSLHRFLSSSPSPLTIHPQ